MSWLSRKGGRRSGEARQGDSGTTDGPAGEDVAGRPDVRDVPDAAEFVFDPTGFTFDAGYDGGVGARRAAGHAGYAPPEPLLPVAEAPGRAPTPWPETPLPVWPAGLVSSPDPVKIVVTGPFGAGKTTFVSSVAETLIVDTETDVSDTTGGLKSSTTVSLDYGALDVPDPSGAGVVRVALFGTPGQQRFSFMWRILGEGMRVFLVLVDASRDHSRDEAREILRTFRRMAPGAPWVVAVNRWHPSDDVDRMVISLGLTPDDVPRLVRADVRDRDTGIALLQLALQHVEPLGYRATGTE